jgi:hypothetical protein
MRTSPSGFALFEVVLGLVLLGIVGGLALRGGLALTAAVRDGRRWTDAALLGALTLADLERSYRMGAPACALPPPGSRSGRGVRVDWAAHDLGGALELTLTLQAGARTGSTDTIVTRVACR